MSTYSPSLRIELITTGDQPGAWGDTTNTNLGTIIESAISGFVTVNVTSANQAFSALDGVADQARNAMIRLTTTTTAPFTVYAPPVSKQYIIWNNSGYAAAICNSTVIGNTVANGAGTSVVSGLSYTVASLGSTTLGQWQALFNTLTLVPTAGQTITATATGTLAGGATVAATVVIANGEKIVVFSNGTNFYAVDPKVLSSVANGVLYANSSNIVTNGSVLTFNGTSLTVNGISVGRGAGGYVTNTALGNDALFSNTSGSSNIAVGRQALYSNTGGSANVAVGNSALYANTTGFDNVALGASALNTNTGGSENIAIGNFSLLSNSSGNQNTAVGTNALRANTGSSNTAVGRAALYSNTTGSNNVAVGQSALYTNTTGSSNVAVGTSALFANITGGNNTAFGHNALSANTSAVSNTAVGDSALYSNTTGGLNVAVGYRALYASTTGTANVAIGANALFANTTASSNVALGNAALTTNTGGSENTAVGTGALGSNTTGSYNTAVGYQALRDNTTGAGNTAINPRDSFNNYAPVFNPTTQSNRVCIGSTGVTNAYIQVAWTVVSDARDKTNFAPVPHGLAFVDRLQPVQYQFKASRTDPTPHGPVRYGFKAQDILALEGNTSVIIDAEDPEKLRYQGESLVPVLVNAIQELSARIKALEAKKE